MLHKLQNLTNLPSKPYYVTIKTDSGASSHFLREQDAHCLKNIKPATKIAINLPDNSQLITDKKGILPLTGNLSVQAKTASIVPGLQSASLLSTPNYAMITVKSLLAKTTCIS